MLDKVKCECGHVNPPGTEICESCGKPFDEESQKVLNMRYEGVARRSQTYQHTFVDKVWSFFSSVKIAIVIIIITLLASMLGTIYPQVIYIPSNVDPLAYYTEQYGQGGYIYARLGLHQMYRSWWYVGLLSIIGISLIICSLDRVIPLYRALNKQKVTRYPAFLSRQKIFAQAEVDKPDHVLTQAKLALEKKRYTVRQEERAIMGEKGRFSRWGPYVVHIGLIIFLIGALIRILPGFQIDKFVWVRDGETVPVPGMDNIYVKSEGFYIETYMDEDFVGLKERMATGEQFIKEFRTDVVLLEKVLNEQTKETEWNELKRQTILVNTPLEYKGLKLFQTTYKLNELSKITLALKNKANGQEIGKVTVDLNNPEPHYQIGDNYTVEIIEYYPDFEIANNTPRTKSNIPNNPAFIFNIISPEVPEGEKSWIFIGSNIEPPGQENLYTLKFNDVSFQSVSGLTVRKDLSLPVIVVGSAIIMLGLIITFYWSHRRIWIQNEAGVIWLAAHANRNWFGIQQEVEFILDQTDLQIDRDSLLRED